ncbi:MAG: HDOD domain-containing protein [Planctomycetota bacterium]
MPAAPSANAQETADEVVAAHAGADDAMTNVPPPRTITADLEDLFQRLSGIASFPVVARRVLEVAGKDDCTATDLLEVIEQDQVLAMKILQTVNSSYYGLPNEVADLRRAITLLGVKQVRNMAMTVIVGRHLTLAPAGAMIDPVRMWDHSVCTAAACRIIAERTKSADPEEAYLAGLIHDSGLLVIDQKLRERMPNISKRYQATRDWMAAEQEVLAFDHAQLGAYIAWRSGFPHRLVAAVDYHHSPTDAEGDIAALASVVSVANYLVSRLGRSAMAERRLAPPLEVTFDRLNLTRHSVRDLWADLEQMLENVGALKAV